MELLSALSEFSTLVYVLALFGVILILFYESINDIKYRRIGKKSVILLYVFCPLALFLSENNLTEASFVFMFSLFIFIAVWIFSFGQFGIGDSLTIASVTMILGTFTAFQNFLLILALISIPWSAYWIVKYFGKKGYKGQIFRNIMILSPDQLKPGMVLKEDNFMNGLNEKDIEKIKDSGIEKIEVKQPLPFIPVVFLAFILVLI